MATNHQKRSVEELEQRVDNLQSRLDSLESIFSERILERERAHTQAKQQDARKHLQPGDTHRVVIDSPPGEGRDPNSAVGRIEGIVVFIDPKEIQIQENDVLKIVIKDVKDSCANANAIEKLKSLG